MERDMKAQKQTKIKTRELGIWIICPVTGKWVFAPTWGPNEWSLSTH